jgi:hypothetical protein
MTLGTKQIMRLAPVLLCLALCACQGNPWVNGFLKTAPKPADLVGSYSVTRDSLERRIELTDPSGKRQVLVVPVDGRIVLTPDQKLGFHHVPDIGQDGRPCTITGAGTWQLITNDMFWMINVHVNRVDYNPSADACRAIYDNQFAIYGQRPPYRLHITIGDPDSADAVQFAKQK